MKNNYKIDDIKYQKLAEEAYKNHKKDEEILRRQWKVITWSAKNKKKRTQLSLTEFLGYNQLDFCKIIYYN